MPTIRTAGLLVALAAMGCAPAEPSGVTEAPTDLPSATVAIGETTRVDGVPVTPLAVLEDSRCARDVACVWAGRVRIRIRIDADNGSREMEMELGEPTQAGITLSAVRPERLSNAPIEPGAYRFTFAPVR
ncbi:hypothetical protein [Allosphingosinicella sp.]|uniref:hypothetical protein n=1 Tax=Allosphingosinicella sp. TaxID=2823234 RepID=UPI002FC231FA